MKQILTIFLLMISTLVLAQPRYSPVLSREEELNNRYTSGLFRTPEGTYFDLENDPNAIAATSYLNVLDWLQGRVAGLQVRTYRNVRIPLIRNQQAAIFVDEIRVDPGFLNLLPVNDIGMIKVMKTPFAGFWNAPGGAIAVYTKKGEENEED
jgi:hypothetical protein